MPLVEIEVTLRVDGQPVAGFPITRRINPAEVQAETITKANGDGVSFVALQGILQGTINALLLRTDTAVNFALDGGSTADVALNAGGLLLVLDGVLTGSNIKINNQAANAASVTAVAAGP